MNEPIETCSRCHSEDIEYDPDCCAIWCLNCEDWAGGEVARLDDNNRVESRHIDNQEDTKI
jgi:hypothetical protein